MADNNILDQHTTMCRTTAPQNHPLQERLGIIHQSLLSNSMPLLWHHLPSNYLYSNLYHIVPRLPSQPFSFLLFFFFFHVSAPTLWSSPRISFWERQWEPSWTCQVAALAVGLRLNCQSNSWAWPGGSDHPPRTNSSQDWEETTATSPDTTKPLLPPLLLFIKKEQETEINPVLQSDL